MTRDLTNQVFGRLTAIKPVSKNRSGQTIWLFKCACNNDYTCSMDHVTRKKYPVKSCGCFKKSIKGPSHCQWGGHEGISGNWWYNHLLRERKQTTREKVPVTVTMKEAWELFLNQSRKCALSGVVLQISTTAQYNTASIDRIDSSKGYELSNIQWVHKHINFMKRTYSQEYFIDMCKLVATTHK